MKMKPNRSLKIVLLSVATAALSSLSALQIAAMEAMPLGKEKEATLSGAFNATSMVKELENLYVEQKKEANQPNNPFAIVSEQCATRTAMELAQCIIASQEHQELYNALISFFVSKLNQDLYKKTDDEKKATLEQKRFCFDKNTKQLLEAEYDRQNNWQLKNMFPPTQNSPNQIDSHRHLRAQIAPDCLSDSLKQLLSSMDATLDAQYVKELKGHTDWVNSGASSPDGKYYVLTESWKNAATICDAETNVCKHALKGHTSLINSVAWSPDGSNYVLTGSLDGTAKIWDAESGLCKHTLDEHKDSVYSATWSPDSKHVLTGSRDKTAKIWDAETGACKHTLTEHIGEVLSVAWSPDSKHVLTGSFDETAKIWDVETGVCKHTLTGHTSRVYSVAWSPDGKPVLTGSCDNTAKIWDVAHFTKNRQAEIRNLNLEQLMLLNYLDQLIQQKIVTLPECVRSVFQGLPKGIRAKIKAKFTLPANSWYESCAIL